MPPSDPPAGMGLDTEQYDAALADMFGRAETATVTTAKKLVYFLNIPVLKKYIEKIRTKTLKNILLHFENI
jgi:hypothetical protein